MKLTITYTKEKSWLDYLYTQLSPYCTQEWTSAEEKDSRSGDTYVTTRATLVTATLSLFYPLFRLFYLTVSPRRGGQW